MRETEKYQVEHSRVLRWLCDLCGKEFKEEEIIGGGVERHTNEVRIEANEFKGCHVDGCWGGGVVTRVDVLPFLQKRARQVAGKELPKGAEWDI